MKTITIQDDGEIFNMMGNKVNFVFPEKVEISLCADELHAFIKITSQMFYDHEDGFYDENSEKTKQARKLFEQLEALYK